MLFVWSGVQTVRQVFGRLKWRLAEKFSWWHEVSWFISFFSCHHIHLISVISGNTRRGMFIFIAYKWVFMKQQVMFFLDLRHDISFFWLFQTMLSRFRLRSGVSRLFDDELSVGLACWPAWVWRFNVKTADNCVGIWSKGSVDPDPSSPPPALDSWCMESSRSISVTSGSFNRPSRDILLWKKIEQ